MPKVNHGPEPKAAPPSLVVLLNSLNEDLPFLFGQQALLMRQVIDRAEVLEERLNDLHDAVEKAIQHLNESEFIDSTGNGGPDGHVAHEQMNEVLAVLNRVL